MLQNSGEEGGPYAGEFTHFLPREIQQHVAVYILQGILPSPQVHFKFYSQEVDDVNNCNFFTAVLGSARNEGTVSVFFYRSR